MNTNTIEWIADESGFIFEPTRAKRETEARELLGEYVEAISAGLEEQREAQRERIVRLLISRQRFETGAQEEASAAHQYGFLDKLTESVRAYIGQPAEGERTALIRQYRSFVRRLVLPHHYSGVARQRSISTVVTE
ncbi:hypothetical protein [Paraburkholderia sp. J67]|uniref:hypothetical protein n=1 Tax=Paraburkholderia sp. J67 TaxID=2805435 RepID=UPI002ABD9C6F|nr:hypothetical protein [Paraburkholderia sp. J67]